MSATYRPRHRAFRTARTKPYRLRFKPKHCAGVTCVHDHHVDDRPPMGVFPQAFPKSKRSAA